MNTLAAASSPATPEDIENQFEQGDDERRMYRAVLRDDWATAMMLLHRNKELAVAPLTKRGHRALHLSIAMKHKKFAKNLIQFMDPKQLNVPDGSGFTACCYAAISDEMTGIADQLIKRNDNVLATRNGKGKTPLQLASLNGKREMISHLVSRPDYETFGLREEEWFDILVSAIRTKMYDIASQILARNKALLNKKGEEAETSTKNEGRKAMSKRDKGTALHILARQDIAETSTTKTAILLKSILGTTFYGRQIYGEMSPATRDFAAELLKKMKECLNEKQMLELLQNPPILFDAAKVGNVELIVMLTREYPDLLWQKDSHDRSIFHYAVIYRQDAVFGLIRQIGGLKNLVVMGTDEEGNNILHLAGKLAHANARDSGVSIPALQMQRELAWFKVEAIVPVTYAKEKNIDGLKPRKLFSKEHENLLKESEGWMKSTADSCMLIATIILTVVYAAAFTVPGGNNGETGLPILERRTWFACFFVFEALALFGSTLCVIVFWSITSSGFKEERFLHILPYQLKLGLSGLFMSLIGAISAFMSAYCLVLVDERAWYTKSIILVIYAMLVLAVCGRFSELWFTMKFPKSLNRMMLNRHNTTLFTQESSL